MDPPASAGCWAAQAARHWPPPSDGGGQAPGPPPGAAPTADWSFGAGSVSVPAGRRARYAAFVGCDIEISRQRARVCAAVIERMLQGKVCQAWAGAAGGVDPSRATLTCGTQRRLVLWVSCYLLMRRHTLRIPLSWAWTGAGRMERRKRARRLWLRVDGCLLMNLHIIPVVCCCLRGLGQTIVSCVSRI